MASSNGDSDIRPDRIQAREDQFRRNIRARRQSPVAKKRVDLTELGCMGAHLDLSKHEPWPDMLELTENEATHIGPVSAPISLDTDLHAQAGVVNSAADESPASRACTPTGCGTYLPPHEYKEFQRQKSANNRRRTSVSTTVEPETQEEHNPNERPEPHDSYSVCYTPSHCSRALTERDDRSVKSAAPNSPEPWSQLDRTIGKNRGGD
ncbi:uncharacterized protein ALTATR162_LOCUS10620 [Alternaria atra]|uniref:Uncharacterized protein n=1 Tax=Alternaria atra TaxID=119953 RepID=A0A8J2I615_9PLEO|nr:uncharacterized protein ALTATR162_LOCUS8125 [Alternaria atra]XP_043174192.1 uncharacterized protein ALTATR162_LOCUS10620 [Alternaria atra]CAG5175528.1 unnamed protein product [Alternaria atra]CAG5183516.1 unnamed protein product [Alternaria atra]